MAFGNFAQQSAQSPAAEINMVPLIDVMLVLLVIFIVTAPLLTHSVRVDLPQVTSQPEPIRPQTIQLAVRSAGDIYWNDERIEPAALAERMREAAASPEPPELHIRADRTAEYRHVARILGLASRTGLGKIGFVSEPEPRHP